MKSINLLLLCLVCSLSWAAGCVSPASPATSGSGVETWETGPFTQQTLSYQSGRLEIFADRTGLLTEKLEAGDTYLFPCLWFRNPENSSELRIFYNFGYETISADGLSLKNNDGTVFTKTDGIPGFVGNWSTRTGASGLTYYENHSGYLLSYYNDTLIASDPLSWAQTDDHTYLIGYTDAYSMISLVQVNDTTLVDSSQNLWVKIP